MRFKKNRCREEYEMQTLLVRRKYWLSKRATRYYFKVVPCPTNLLTSTRSVFQCIAYTAGPFCSFGHCTHRNRDHSAWLLIHWDLDMGQAICNYWQ